MSEKHDDQQNPSQSGTFLSSNEVVEQLGISKSTLYAYVSRGLIHSEPVPHAPRTKRYRAADVERLLRRQRQRSGDSLPEQPGTTTVSSKMSHTSEPSKPELDDTLPYNGYDLQELTEKYRFENAVSLLWTGDLETQLPKPDAEASRRRTILLRDYHDLLVGISPPRRMQLLLPIMEQWEPAAWDWRDETLLRIGADILHLGLHCVTGGEGRSGFARTIRAHWAPGKTEFDHPIEVALILAADQGNDLATKSAMIAAQAGATLFGAVNAGLSTFMGNRAGGSIHQVDALINEIGTPESAYQQMRARLERGESLPGFVNANDNVRVTAGEIMINKLLDIASETPTMEILAAMIEAADKLQGLRPELSLGVASLCRVMGRTPGTGVAIITFARLAGLIHEARRAINASRSCFSG